MQTLSKQLGFGQIPATMQANIHDSKGNVQKEVDEFLNFKSNTLNVLKPHTIKFH